MDFLGRHNYGGRIMTQIPYRRQKKELKVGEITHTGHVKRVDRKREEFKNWLREKVEATL